MKTSGELVAATLAGSWREQTKEPQLSTTELTSITPLLLQSGAGALTWWRLRNSPLANESALGELQQAYRLHALQAVLHEINLQKVFKLLQTAGVEAILVKGWSIARLYPEIGLRPYGDIDLCVAPDQYALAQDALREPGDRYPLDLHVGTSMLDDRSWDEVFARSQLVVLDETVVRVLAPEDHLRVLCFHLLRHGVERPIGLCDIAVALEQRAT
ncbi:MAG TPA: nucleotidyltransferase family protein, partial [Pyrinomonadaceae bacterium]|nr:nucleotidyltransferase family protein [Pyrinomonadaceae bacterium]